MKKYFVIVLLLLVVSCSENPSVMLEDSQSVDKNLTINSCSGIELTGNYLTSENAKMVATIFNQISTKTRSEKEKHIKSIIPILGDNGKVYIYAVNFDVGYVLVSGTVFSHPILAIVDKGEYTLSHIETGEDVVIKEMISNIQALEKDGNSDIFKSEWSLYSHTKDLRDNILNTRSMNDPDYWVAFDDWYYNYDTSDREKCRIFNLYGATSTFTDSEYNSIVNEYFTEQDLWEGTDYKWENTAYIVEERDSYGYNGSPLLSTAWHQRYPYNITSYETLGCVTIAVGQIMKFFQYPESYQWNNMYSYGSQNNLKATPELQNFLAKLRDELEVSSGGSSSISDAKRVFESYGYSVREIHHDSSAIINHIMNKKKPVYARGQKDWKSKGHAWVIDGIYYSQTGTTYKLYYLDPSYYPNFRYTMVVLDKSSGSSLVRYHMNWGWGGQSDGWFSGFPNIKVNTTDGVKDYSYDRKELIIDL